MRIPGMGPRLAAVLAACLLAAGCAGAKAEQAETPEEQTEIVAAGYETFPFAAQAEDTLSLSACFLGEDGTAVSGGKACFSQGEDSAVYELDDNGELRLSGLPREGEITLTLYDAESRELGDTTLYFSRGAVIDASSDQDGGYVTTRGDTEEVALDFTVSGTRLLTALSLSE